MLRKEEVIAIKEGETQVIDGIQIKAVPAYNIKRMRSPGQPYHPRGFGVGYVIAVECFKAIKPKIAIPYHQGEANPNEVKKLLADMPEIEVKVYKLP